MSPSNRHAGALADLLRSQTPATDATSPIRPEVRRSTVLLRWEPGVLRSDSAALRTCYWEYACSSPANRGTAHSSELGPRLGATRSTDGAPSSMRRVPFSRGPFA